MNAPETKLLLKDALAAAADGAEDVEAWLELHGLDVETFGKFLFLMSEGYRNPLEAMTQIGKGFHIGWEAHKLMQARGQL